MGLEKINELKKSKGLTNKKISELTGISISSLDKITSGDNKNPKLETVQLICRALECKLSDLLDDGINSETPNSDELKLIKKYRTLDEHGRKIVDFILEEEYTRCINTGEPTMQIKHSVYKVSAGCGFDLDNRDDWEEIEIPDTPEARKADFAITIKGNSMEPLYYNGDIVLVKSQPAVDLGETGIYIINGSGFIKRYGGDRLISVNSDYEDITFTEDDNISCAGKVIGSIKAS